MTWKWLIIINEEGENVTLEEQRSKLRELIETGRKLIFESGVRTGRTRDLSGILIPKTEFERWMGQINTFNSRHLKNHPQHSDINTKFFLRKNYFIHCEEMVGILQAVYDDEEFWGKPNEVRPMASEKVVASNPQEDKIMQPVIFISHRSIDADVADMLKDYLVETGISNEYIFCSSLPGNDVRQQISVEVKQKMKNSTVNIAILSMDYYKSAYCLNEAGIIWLQDSTPAITIGLPEIEPEKMYGFLNGDNKLRRLDNSDDIAAIYDIIQKAVTAKQATMAIATAASKKLVSRYTAYLSARKKSAEALKVETSFSIENITTDDEKILLYYIISAKTKKISKSAFSNWLVQNELYGIRVDNAFDLLSSIGSGKLEDEELNLDMGLFRRCTTNTEKLLDELKPIYEHYQKLSSVKFITMWKNGVLQDEDKLFVAYIIQNRTTSFGTRWMEKGQIEDVRQWEMNNSIDGSLASTYTGCLNLFVENDLVYPSSWTSYNNVREYTLCSSLRELLIGKKFEHYDELLDVMERHKDTLPF